LLNTKSSDPGVLYVVSTPIGNLGDITLRALETLGAVDYIACEDTRVTIKLLNRYEIKKKMKSLHAASPEAAVNKIAGDVGRGLNVAYVTDSGTPSVSDPGCSLCRAVLQSGGSVVSVPGPSAVHAALVGSGIGFSGYTFIGFLSNKKSRRRRDLLRLRENHEVLVFYESPHRLLAFMQDVLDIFGNIEGCVAKELTKKFEKYYRGGVENIIEDIVRDGARGEYTVVLDNRRSSTERIKYSGAAGDGL